MKKALYKRLICVLIFAISMALLESSVVIYLRELYYPEGFSFPIKIIPRNIAKVEIWREIATILMLIGIGYLAGKTWRQRFAYFALSFAVWDIFYYVFLYVFIAWPESIFTWDLLFLLPFPWTGPVWAPCLISLFMIFSSLYFILTCENKKEEKIKVFWWILLFSGAFICILSFLWDFLQLSDNFSNLNDILSNQQKANFIAHYVPEKFNSPLFLIGFFTMLITVLIQFINPLKFRKNEHIN